MKKTTFLLGLMVLFGFPDFCLAEDEQKSREAVDTLDEVVVSATKTEEKRKDVSSFVIVVDEMDIEESPAKTLGELLANEPGIDWRTRGDYGGARGEIHIRGMSGDATQVRVNGVTVNSPSFGSADVSKIPLNSIERIEVVEGSGSVLYGSGAMGGTVNIITKRPEREKTDLKASAGFGSQSTYGLAAEQGMFAVGDFGYYLTANRYRTLGFRSNSDLSHNDASINLVLDKGDILNVSLYGDYIYRDFGVPGVQPPAGTQSYYIHGTEFFNSESASLLNRGRDNDAHGVLNIDSKPTDWVDLKFRGDYTYMDGYNYDRWTLSGIKKAAGARTWVTNKVLGFEGDVDFKPFEGANLLVGSEYKHYTWENKNTALDSFGADVPGSTSYTSARLHTLGIYAEAQYRPSKYIKGVAGVRHEDHSEFGTEDLPRFGLIVNPLDSTAVKFNYGKHFRAPTPNDLFWPESPYTKGNPDLKPETGWHFDAGIEQELLGNRVFLSLTYFNWNLKDKIQWGPDINWVWTPQNLDKAKANGLEVGTKIGPFYDVTLALDYTYTDAEEENQYVTRRATYTPEHLFRGNLTYWAPFGLTATATLRYVGDRYFYGTDKTTTDPVSTLDPYVTMDLRLEQRFFQNWLLSLEGNNLFNKSYDTYFGSFTDPTAKPQTSSGKYPGAGRSVFFKATYEF
ncbi:MAG: TonB-dependent receptor [Desulfobacteraceae bacterium]|nr:TonB-dependent receptor [Desulfobacteraceae bacterium]